VPHTPKKRPEHETLRRPDSERTICFGSLSSVVARRLEFIEEKVDRDGPHIINGPVFSAYTNRWGADCSCGWKTSHDWHYFVQYAVTQHGRIAAGFRVTRRKACADKIPAYSTWCMVCGFRFTSLEAAPDI
jgi:hypothetical protein